MQTQFDSLAQLLPAAQTLRTLVLGGAKVMPVVLLVPAFGLRALPIGARVGLALTMGLSVAPALPQSSAQPLGLALALEALSALPIALSAAAALWAASMAGSFVNELRQARGMSHLPVVPRDTRPTGALFGLVAAIAFLQTGGPVRVVSALSRQALQGQPLLTRVVRDLLSGVHIALAMVVPFLVASVLFELTVALVARALNPARLELIWAPVRAVFILIILAVVLERLLALIVLIASQTP